MASVQDERAVLVSLLVGTEINANLLTQVGWFCSSVHSVANRKCNNWLKVSKCAHQSVT